MKTGDVIFFKKAKYNLKKGGMEYGFKGNGFGIMLGHVDEDMAEPQPKDVLNTLALIGFFSLNHILEYFESEKAEAFVKYAVAKINEKPEEKPSPLVSV